MGSVRGAAGLRQVHPPPAGLSPSQVETLWTEGYLHIPGFFDLQAELRPVIDEITRSGQRIDRGFDFHDGATIEALDQPRRGALYNMLRYLPSLMQLASSETLLDASRSFGLAMPMVLRSYNIRMDTPFRDEFLFHWHQDITYLLGSPESVTYWIPLAEANAHKGSIEVVPRSHKAGIRPFRYTGTKTVERNTALSPSDIHLVEEPTEPGVIIEAVPGDLIVFSQFTLHRSTPNRSGETRWTVQVRHADAFDQAFIDAGYPCGDATNIYHTRLYGEFSRD